jgi:hypothetical protein
MASRALPGLAGASAAASSNTAPGARAATTAVGAAVARSVASARASCGVRQAAWLSAACGSGPRELRRGHAPARRQPAGRRRRTRPQLRARRGWKRRRPASGIGCPGCFQSGSPARAPRRPAKGVPRRGWLLGVAPAKLRRRRAAPAAPGEAGRCTEMTWRDRRARRGAQRSAARPWAPCSSPCGLLRTGRAKRTIPGRRSK